MAMKKNKQNKKFKQKLVRRNLFSLVGQTIPISAVIQRKFIHSTTLSKKPILITDCVVDNELHTDHFWVSLTEPDRTKLWLMPNNSRVYFTGRIHLYTSRHEHESAKIGIQALKLVHKEYHGSN